MDYTPRFAQSLTGAGVRPAPPVQELRRIQPLDELPPTVGDWPVIGMASANLQPQTITAEGMFLVTGAPGFGRTS